MVRQRIIFSRQILSKNETLFSMRIRLKTGDDKVGLDGNMKHNEYVCYKCGAVMDRDENAVMNLLELI